MSGFVFGFWKIYVIMVTLLIGLGLANFNSSSFNGFILVLALSFYLFVGSFWLEVVVPHIMLKSALFILSVAKGLVVNVTKMKDFHIKYVECFLFLC